MDVRVDDAVLAVLEKSNGHVYIRHWRSLGLITVGSWLCVFIRPITRITCFLNSIIYSSPAAIPIEMHLFVPSAPSCTNPLQVPHSHRNVPLYPLRAAASFNTHTHTHTYKA